jgi:DNA-binding phage protein
MSKIEHSSNDIAAHLNRVLALDGSLTFQIMLLQTACSRHEVALVAQHAEVRRETLWRYRNGAARAPFETLIKVLPLIGAKLVIVAD